MNKRKEILKNLKEILENPNNENIAELFFVGKNSIFIIDKYCCTYEIEITKRKLLYVDPSEFEEIEVDLDNNYLEGKHIENLKRFYLSQKIVLTNY